jgi:hypothetical protein
MENPQSLEEVLHELEWLVKTEADNNEKVKSEEQIDKLNLNETDNHQSPSDEDAFLNQSF